MRKLLNSFMVFLFALCLGLLVNSSSIYADSTDFTYTSDGLAVTVTGYTGSNPDMIVPDTIDDLPVTAIAAEAFKGNTFISTVTLPDSIQTIGINAFTECSALTDIDLSNTQVTVLNRYFYNCTSLKSLKLPAAVTYIPYDMCRSCSHLEAIDLSQTSITRISTSAFEGCISLSSVIFPDTLTSIGNRAFYGCTALKTLTVSDKVTTISDSAFEKTGITSVTTPAGSYAEKYFAPIIMNNLPGAGMKFQKSSYTLYIGQSKKLKVENYAKSAVYASSKKSVATVDQKGKVTAKKKGKAVISVSLNGHKAKCTVTVKNVKINKKKIALATGLTYKLALTKNLKAKWKSSKKSVAEVSSKGLVTAKKAGTTVITATRNGKKYKCTVTVYKNQIISDGTFKATGSNKVLLTLKKIERVDNTYKAYVHASYVGGYVTGVDNLNISILNNKKTILTKTVSHIDGSDFVITFYPSEQKSTNIDLTTISPAIWAKGNFLFTQVL